MGRGKCYGIRTYVDSSPASALAAELEVTADLELLASVFSENFSYPSRPY
jgi:hypothetical protein